MRYIYPKQKKWSYLFVLVLALVNFGVSSCSQKVYPSGLEGNLTGSKVNFKKEQRDRQRIARKTKRKTLRLEQKALKPHEKRKAEARKAQAKFVVENKKKQHPEVQERMKRNEKETRRKYSKLRAEQKKVKWSKELKKRFKHGK